MCGRHGIRLSILEEIRVFASVPSKQEAANESNDGREELPERAPDVGHGLGPPADAEREELNERAPDVGRGLGPPADAEEAVRHLEAGGDRRRPPESK